MLIKNKFSAVLAITFLFTLSGCLDDQSTHSGEIVLASEASLEVGASPDINSTAPSIIDDYSFTFDFTTGLNEWRMDFSDYPKGSEELYNLTAKWLTLPEPLSGLNGIYLSGDNRSDDLFMYIKRKISGLRPNTQYSVIVNLQLASKTPGGCVGVGGSPGESVYVKVGASSVEPVSDRELQGFLRMNLDHGFQGNSGSEAIVVGNIATSLTDCSDRTYQLKELDNTSISLKSSTSPDGTLWVLIGTDSGFEGTTSIYYTFAQVSLFAL